jgi:hypothetical protein
MALALVAVLLRPVAALVRHLVAALAARLVLALVRRHQAAALAVLLALALVRRQVVLPHRRRVER